MTVRQVLVLVSCCVLVFARSTGGNEFRSDYTYLPEVGGWLKMHSIPRDWNTARMTCYYEGAVLASPLTEELHKAMIATKNQDFKEIFTGISATLSQGAFSSVEGNPIESLFLKWNYETYPDENSQCLIYLADSIAYGKCQARLPFFCFRKVSVADELTECGTVDKGYKLDGRTGSCYKFHARAATWRWAAGVCQAEGGHLVVLNSPAEAAVLKDLFAANQHLLYTAYQNTAAVGFSKWDSDTWWTIHGKPLEESGYTSWSKGQPDNAGGRQSCGAIFRDALLDDMDCNQPIAFICEKSPYSLLNVKLATK